MSVENFHARERGDNQISVYEGFDENFFGFPLFTPVPKDKRTDLLREAAQKYRDLIKNDEIQNILSGQVQPDELTEKTKEDLLELRQYEIQQAGDQLQRTKDGDVWRELGVKEVVWELRGSRILAHLSRLLSSEHYYHDFSEHSLLKTKIQNSVCRNFAQDYAHYIAAVSEEEQEEKREVIEIIDDEGENVRCFWTLAPYIYDELKKETNAETAMARTLDWAKQKNTFRELKIFSMSYVLGYDERMPSHLLARLLAKQVVADLNRFATEKE